MTETQTLTAKANTSVPSELPFQNTDTAEKTLKFSETLPTCVSFTFLSHAHTHSLTQSGVKLMERDNAC